jgi:predicted lipid-binding transport protein (Tim44 family)
MHSWASGYRYTDSMPKLPLISPRLPAAALVMALCAVPAWAQWQWTDASGRKVYSDTAPPPTVPDNAILHRPGEPRKPPAAPNAPAAGKNLTGPTAPTSAASDKKAAELEAKKKAAEDAEKAKAKAEEQKAAQVRAENCQRAQRALASLNTESRVSTVNARGERVIMDETMRNAEKTRLQQVVQQSCRP